VHIYENGSKEQICSVEEKLETVKQNAFHSVQYRFIFGKYYRQISQITNRTYN